MYLYKYFKTVSDKFYYSFVCIHVKKGKKDKINKRKKDRALREYFLKYGIIIFTFKCADSSYKAD